MKVRKEMVLKCIKKGQIITKAYIYKALGLGIAGVDLGPAGAHCWMLVRKAIVDGVEDAQLEIVGVYDSEGNRI